MFKNKELKLEITTLKTEIEALNEQLAERKIVYDFNNKKIEDDFNVLNQILDLKTSHYITIIFLYNRYQQEKKVNVTTDEIDKATKTIISETIKALSKNYLDYLTDKYFDSTEALVDIYTQRVYLKLFDYANKYNIESTNKSFKKI